MSAYKKDLAYIHDVGFGSFAKNAVPGLLEILRQKGITTGLVVDLGCGSGIWAREPFTTGCGVLGIDISTDTIEIARKRVPEGEFHKGSFLKVKLPKCNAVTLQTRSGDSSFAVIRRPRRGQRTAPDWFSRPDSLWLRPASISEGMYWFRCVQTMNDYQRFRTKTLSEEKS